MFGMKFPQRLDQPAYWMWVVPLVLGHLAILMSGAKGLGALDTVVIVWLSMVVAVRFKDIGWPRWIAPVFMLGTMLLLPLVPIGFAIATNAAALDCSRFGAGRWPGRSVGGNRAGFR